MRKALVVVLFGTLCAALPAQNLSITVPTVDRYAYSIQYVPKNDIYKARDYRAFSKKGVESYDTISRYLQERLSREVEARGFHLAGTADSAAFKFTIDLMEVSDNSGIGNQFSPIYAPYVTVQAALSIADSAGTLIYHKEFAGKAKLAGPGQRSERFVTMAGRAADDLMLKLDNDQDFKKVLYVPGGVTASSPAPVVPSGQEAAPAQAAESAQTPSVPPSQAATASAQPRLVQLPAGTAVLLTLDQDFDTRKANEGDIISFTLAEDLRVGAETVASAGVKARGSFYREALSKGRRFLLGGVGGGVTSAMPAGDPHIRMGYIEIGDLRVNLRSEQPQSQEQSLAPGAEILGAVRRKSGKLGWYFYVDQGTRFRAYTVENINLPSGAPAVQSDQQTKIAPAKTALGATPSK